MAAARLLVILEAQTARFEAAMQAASQQLARMDRPTVQARRGIMLLQSGMQSLAFQATGLPGPMGKVAQALGVLTIGSPLMLGIAAGIGGFVLLTRKLGEGLRDAQKQAQETGKALEALLAKGRPSVAITQELFGFGERLGLSEQIGSAQAQIDRLRAGGSPWKDWGKKLQEIAALQTTINNLTIRQAALTEELDRAHQDLADKALKDQLKVLEEQRVQLDLQVRAMLLQIRLANDLKEIFASITVPDVSEFLLQAPLPLPPRRFQPGGIRPPEPQGFGAGRFQPQPWQQRFAFPPFGTSFNLTGPPPQVKKGFDELGEAMRLAGIGAGDMEAAVVTAFGTMIASVISDTDRMGATVVSGFFQMVEQILMAERAMAIQRATIAAAGAAAGGATAAGAAAAGAAAGGFLATGPGAIAIAGVAILGGIIGGILGKRKKEVQPVRDDRSRQEIERLRAELKEQGRERLISVTIVDPFGRELSTVRYELDRQTRRDAVPRIP